MQGREEYKVSSKSTREKRRGDGYSGFSTGNFPLTLWWRDTRERHSVPPRTTNRQRRPRNTGSRSGHRFMHVRRIGSRAGKGRCLVSASARLRLAGVYVYPRCVSLASLGGLGAASLILWKPAFPAMPPCVLPAACLACDVALSLSAGLIACCHPRSNASLAMTYGRDCRDDPSAGEARRPPARGDVRAREPGPPPGNM